MLNSDFKTIFEQPTINDLKVGQVWKCLEDQKIVLISRCILSVERPFLAGYIFTGFEIGDYYSYALNDFVKYYKCIYNPKR